MVECGGTGRKPEGLRGKEKASLLISMLGIYWAEEGHFPLFYTAMSAMRYEVTAHTHKR